MVKLQFKHDDDSIREATLKAAKEMHLLVELLPNTNGEFVVTLDDAEHAYRFGAKTAIIRAQAILKETQTEVM